MRIITPAILALAALGGIMWLGWRMHPDMGFGQAGLFALHAARSLIWGVGFGAGLGLVYLWYVRGRQ